MRIFGLAIAAVLATAGTARASTVYFEFTGSSILPGFDGVIQQIPGTVTGHIDGLLDNSSSSATGLFIDSAPVALHFDYSLNLINSDLFSDISSKNNSFQMNTGNIESYYLNADGGTNIGVFFLMTNTPKAPFIPFSGLTIKIGDTFPGVVSDAGVSFSSVPFSVSPVPLPSALPMFGAALAGLTAFGAKRRRMAIES